MYLFEVQIDQASGSELSPQHLEALEYRIDVI
jgi:hypothetical protein